VRGRASTLLRLGVAIGLTWLSIWQADWRQFAAALAATSWAWVAGACGLVVVDRALNAYRWIGLLGPVRPRPPLSSLFRIFFVSTFVGTFLPSTVGIDAVRAWRLSLDRVPPAQAIASVLVDRLLGVASTLVVAIAGLALLPRLILDPAVGLALGTTALGCLGALAVIFSPRFDRMLRARLGWLPVQLRAWLDRLLDAIQAYGAERRLLSAVLGASLAVQLLRVAQAWMLGQGLGLTAPAVAYLAFIPVIVLIMLLPITINGLGTGQVAFVWAFGLVGVDAAAALALSVLFVGLGIVGNLPGGLIYAFGRPGRKAGT
jgi:uncharacterized membrane protein YbhN (UPF0104 family)